MKKILIEACCGSAEDAVMAAQGGADRIELNSCLYMGGLTPTIGTLEAVKASISIPVLCMLRPRAGGFDYSEMEFDCLLRDARALLHAGADGVVCGCLRADGTVDSEKMARVMEVAGGKPVVFHRAMDVVRDWHAAMDTLIRLGVTRVLTSGQARTAPEGAKTLLAMRAYAAGRIEILPGCGINADNVRELIQATCCDQVHLSGRHILRQELSARNNRGISFAGTLPEEESVPVTDAEAFRTLRRCLEK